MLACMTTFSTAKWMIFGHMLAGAAAGIAYGTLQLVGVSHWICLSAVVVVTVWIAWYDGRWLQRQVNGAKVLARAVTRSLLATLAVYLAFSVVAVPLVSSRGRVPQGAVLVIFVLCGALLEQLIHISLQRLFPVPTECCTTDSVHSSGPHSHGENCQCETLPTVLSSDAASRARSACFNTSDADRPSTGHYSVHYR